MKFKVKLRRAAEQDLYAEYPKLPRKAKKEVVYGLHERGHSPTLIYPRPKWVKSDADMDRLFLNYSFEEIAEMIGLK